MSKQSAASATTHAAPSISLLLTNLHLLDLDRRDDWPSITAQIFTNKNTLQNEKTRIQCVEWAFYRLFEIWDPIETKDKLGPFFPALVPLQSLNLRAALFRCLNELKKNGVLGKEVIVRKTFFDDCKGERIQELLISFSTLVLRKVLAIGHDGRSCIAARLATAKTVTAKEQQSFLPLAIAHRASLTALLRRKKDLRERSKNFGAILDAKEQELDQRLGNVVSTQDFLEKNPIPDHKVARVSKLFATNWQGDPKLLEVITQGEGHEMKDSLLDTPFSETWLQVSAGTFDGATGTTWQGLLQDLEERVAKQEARLTDWRNFKDAIKRDEKGRSAAKTSNSTLFRTRSEDPNNQKQRDFVFSPRKSPRKSDWKMEEARDDPSPTHPKRLRKEGHQNELEERGRVFSPRKSPRKSLWPVEEDLRAKSSPGLSQAILKHKETETVGTENETTDGNAEDPVRRVSLSTNREDTTSLSPQVLNVDGTDESGFSEISNGQLHLTKSLDDTVRADPSGPEDRFDQAEASSNLVDDKPVTTPLSNRSRDIPSPSDHSDMRLTEENKPTTSDDNDSWISSLPVESTHEDKNKSPSPNEGDDELAEQIVSMTINAAPTATKAKAKASLMERTRQSMAFASPVGLQTLLPEGLSSPTPIPRPPPPHLTTDPPGAPKSLLERTRQSISLVPSKPKGSRKSILDRPFSKPYPTNPFDTPKRQLEKVTEQTPPEELFNPGANYDSVFKSRPKIALSPNPSPRPRDDSETDGAGEERDGGSRDGDRQREESPLARKIANV